MKNICNIFKLKGHLEKSTTLIKIFTLSLIILFLFIRNEASFTNPMFYAEDGVIFFQQNITLGWYAFFTSYAGYLHTIIRCVAFIASYFPFTFQPALYVYSSLAILLLVALKILSSRVPFPLLVRVCFALLLVLVPTSGETLMILVDVQFVSSFLLIILLIQKEPHTKIGLYSDLFIAFFIGLSGPSGILLTPLFLIKWFINRNSYNFILATFITFTTVAQLYMGHMTALPIYLKSITLLEWTQFFGIQPWAIFFGISGSLTNVSLLWLNLFYLTLFWILLPLFIYPKNKASYLLFIILFINILAMTIRLSGSLSRDPNFFTALNNIVGSRYTYVPAVLSAWLLILSISEIGQHFLKRFIATLLLGMILWHSFLNFYTNIFPTDFHWASYATQAKTGATFNIAINPYPWKINCSNYSCDNRH